MIADVRAQYNATFTDEKYHNFLADLDAMFNYHIPFRVAETPVFFNKAMKGIFFKAADDIIDFIVRPDFKDITNKAIPDHFNVPNENNHTHFLALDFAICKDETGNYIPQLIELQGFPSLFAWEDVLAHKYREHFWIPDNYSQYFTNNQQEYQELLKKMIKGEHQPENVVLLEIDPYRQGTAIDFMLTERLMGIKVLHIGEVIRKAKALFYINDKGIEIPIKRIYNRIIFDEFVQRTDLFGKIDFNLTEDVDVEWAGHPNWFFRISKYIMPMLKNKYVPECRLLHEYAGHYPADLENYVLKPLFSFSGSGVVFNCTLSDVRSVPQEEHNNWMLQRKVKYEEVVKAGDDGYVKPEVRLLYFWPEGAPRPLPVINLMRLSRGEMIGVKYNKNKTWVGGSVGMFEK